MSVGLFYSGLDLGQAKDFCALACAQRLPNPTPRPRRPWRYEVRHLEAWELGTSYVEVAGDVERRFAHPTLRGSALVPDATGVGRPVCDLLRSRRVKARLVPVLTTAGKIASRTDDGVWNVPKVELVTTLQVLMQDGLVQVDPRLKLAGRLKKELQEFRVKITQSRNETFGAEASQHDDLVFSLMLAVWLGERDGGGVQAGIGTPPAGEGSAVESAPDGVFLSPPE